MRGFTLTELMVTLAVVGVVAAALTTVMNNFNAQSERMNAQTELLLGARQIADMIKPWGALAGYRLRTATFESDPTQDGYPARITDNGNQVLFCYDPTATQRRHTQFRVRDKRLQRRVTDDANCLPTSDEANWVAVSEPIIEDINFVSLTDQTLDIKLDLENAGTRATFRLRLPLYAMLGL